MKLRSFWSDDVLNNVVMAVAKGVEIRFQPDGAIVLLAGMQDNGQAHRTTLTQILSDRLGYDADGITIRQGDSAQTLARLVALDEHHQRFRCCPYCRRDAARRYPAAKPSWLHSCRCQLCKWSVFCPGQQSDDWAGLWSGLRRRRARIAPACIMPMGLPGRPIPTGAMLLR